MIVKSYAYHRVIQIWSASTHWWSAKRASGRHFYWNRIFCVLLNVWCSSSPNDYGSSSLSSTLSKRRQAITWITYCPNDILPQFLNFKLLDYQSHSPVYDHSFIHCAIVPPSWNKIYWGQLHPVCCYSLFHKISVLIPKRPVKSGLLCKTAGHTYVVPHSWASVTFYQRLTSVTWGAHASSLMTKMIIEAKGDFTEDDVCALLDNPSTHCVGIV